MSDLNDTTGLRQRDIKKSKFVASTALGDGAFLDFVINGQNLKISKADFLAAIGTFGTLIQKGEITGIAVLNKDVTVNEIRNIIGGSGILASLSPEDGVQIDHNFTVDSTGAEIMKDQTAASPTFRSIVGGPGISAAVQNGFIQIALSATPVSTKTVIVNEIGDFPTPVIGVITLEDDTMYLITNDISSANRFVLGNDTVVTASDGTLIELEYTGSGVMFTSLSHTNKLRDAIWKCESGTFLDLTGTLGTEIFQVVNSRVMCDEIGTVDTMFTTNFQNVVWDVTTDGILFVNNNAIISFFQNIGTIAAGTFLDLGTSTTTGVSFTNSFGVLSAGAVFISGLADSGNINAGGLATVLNTRALGAGTSLNNINEKDALWEFLANSGMKDSRNTLLATNAGATIVIAAANTPVILGATWVEKEVSRFEMTAGGRFTYIGAGAFISLHATITASIVTATDECTFYFFKNGVEVTDSGIPRTLTAGAEANLSMLWGDEFETDDYIEIFAENNDATVNIVIDNAIVRFD